MLLSIIVLLFLIFGIVLLVKNDQSSKFWDLGLVITFISSFFSLICFGVIMTKLSEKSLSEKYAPIKQKYDFILKQDSIPFEIKKSLYDECYNFNHDVENSIKFEHNIWVGWLYQKPDTAVTFFDMTKFN